MKSSLTSTHRFRVTVALVALATALITAWIIVGGADEQQFGSFSSPQYDSIEQLTASADLVIEGEVTAVLGRETDYGTADAAERVGESGVPFVYYEVKVSEVLKGTATERVVVGNVDGTALVSDSITPLNPGDAVVLFLIEQTRAMDSPGLTLYDSYYTTLSLDAGVFDISDDGRVTPRAVELLPSVGTDLTPDELADQISEFS